MKTEFELEIRSLPMERDVIVNIPAYPGFAKFPVNKLTKKQLLGLMLDWNKDMLQHWNYTNYEDPISTEDLALALSSAEDSLNSMGGDRC